MAKHIAIYTTNTCAYCVMVKRYLQMKNLPYDEINLDTNPERREELQKMTDAMTVPVTVVTADDDTKQVIRGYNLAQLAPAVA